MNVRDLVEVAIKYRVSMGHRYPDGAVDDIASRVTLPINQDNRSAIIDHIAELMKEIERPFHSNPDWDGSIG